MTLLDAKEYNPAPARHRRNRIISAVLTLLFVGCLLWWNRNLPYERVVDHFFAALQQKDYEAAYGIWMNDSQWKLHQDKYSQYPYSDFYRDWGPGGEWGLVRSHSIYGSTEPKGGGSGVIVEAVVNGRSEHARIWVQKSDKTLSFSPY